MSNEEAFKDSKTAVMNQIRPPYSDDQDARKGMIQFDDVSCRSVLSAFVELKNDGKLTKQEAQPLYDAYLATLAPTQKAFLCLVICMVIACIYAIIKFN